MIFRIVAIFALVAFPVLSCSNAAEPTAVELSRAGDWILHRSTGEGPKLCFIAASPRAKEPTNANRSKVVLYVSAWPKEGVRNELSVKLGYQAKAGQEVVLEVDTTTFTLFSKDDRAFVADPTQELKLVQAMKAGQKLVVRGTSERGTATTDTYSLTGFAQALQGLVAACP